MPSKLDEFKPVIDQWPAKEPRLLATRVHQDLTAAPATPADARSSVQPMAHARRAEIHMLPTDTGGLRVPLQTPTRHLLLVFHGDEQLQIGADITVDGGVALEPGASYSVQLDFWAPEAETALAHRDHFDLWAGRKLGVGRLSADRS